MTSHGLDYARYQPPRGEKPRLLPFNRRLRHLQGITLRNLNLVPTAHRNRGKTIDDEALPFALKSPTKLEISNENETLVHTRSSGDLQARSPNSSPLAKKNNLVTSEGRLTPSKKPSFLKARRRSTLDWYATPLQRHEKLQDSLQKHKADLFFSIHVSGLREPVYVSEVSENAMNPNFRFFDLSSCRPFIRRNDKCTVNFWAKSASDTEWHYHLELTVQLRNLQFLGKNLENYFHSLPENAVLFHLSDGVYTSFPETTISTKDGPTILPQADTLPSQTETTSTYDALMRLATLDECIQDAISTQQRLANEINSLYKENHEQFSSPDQLEIVKDSHASMRRSIAAERRQIKILSNRLAEQRASLAARKETMKASREAQKESEKRLKENETKLTQCRELHQKVLDDTHGQRRRICEDLHSIYPINPIPNRALEFTIRELPVPNSDFSSMNPKEDVVSAAFGFVAHLVYLLSFYLVVPLPYPINPMSSQSTIRDPISLMAGSRSFPLHLGRGSAMFRFEYGVFLLNKNIETLSAKLGLKVIDIRQTLPNLKYLLFVATAGKGDLPARRAGGVRGLLRGGSFALNGNSSQDSSRRGSEDSVDVESFRRRVGLADGSLGKPGVGGKGKQKEDLAGATAKDGRRRLENTLSAS